MRITLYGVGVSELFYVGSDNFLADVQSRIAFNGESNFREE